MCWNAVREFDDGFFLAILTNAWRDQMDSAHDVGHIRRVLNAARLTIHDIRWTIFR